MARSAGGDGAPLVASALRRRRPGTCALLAALRRGDGADSASSPSSRPVGVSSIADGASPAASRERYSNRICLACTKAQGECAGARNWTACPTMEDSEQLQLITVFY
jgi:hypothetical protein